MLDNHKLVGYTEQPTARCVSGCLEVVGSGRNQEFLNCAEGAGVEPAKPGQRSVDYKSTGLASAQPLRSNPGWPRRLAFTPSDGPRFMAVIGCVVTFPITIREVRSQRDYLHGSTNDKLHPHGPHPLSGASCDRLRVIGCGHPGNFKKDLTRGNRIGRMTSV